MRGPLTLAFVLYRLYWKLPPAQRRQLIDVMRKHGPTVAQKGAGAVRVSVTRAADRRRRAMVDRLRRRG